MKETCIDCLLRESKEIPYRSLMGNNYSECDIIFGYESPGTQELKKGQMLIADSLDVTMKEVKRIGLDPQRVFLLNASRCMIQKDELSSGQINDILAHCRPNFQTAIHAIKPKLIVCFGAFAFQQAYKKSTLKNAREQFYWSDEFNCWIMCTYHPGAVLRDPQKKPLLQSDMDRMIRFINNDFQIEESVTWKEVDSIRPILDGDCYSEGNYYLVGIDTETQGVNWEDPNSITLSYQVSKNLNEGWTVVLHSECNLDEADFTITTQRGGSKQNPKYETIGIKREPNYEQKIEELRELLSRQDIKKYYMNQKYELHRFMNLGVTEWANNVMDVKAAAHTLDSELYLDVDLETLISRFTSSNQNPKGLINDAEKQDMIGLLGKDRERFIKYASLDPAYTLQVALEIKKELMKDKKSLNYYVNFVHPVETDFLFELERNGVMVDTEKLPEVKKEISDEMERVTNEFRKKCPQAVVDRHKHKFKLTRDIIIKEALFEWTDGKLKKNQKEAEHHNYGFNLEPIVWNKKSGAPGTDKKQVMRVILEGNYSKKVKRLVEDYQYWSELNKLLTNYIKNIEEKVTAEGRLHASFSVTFTSSGRTGVRKPALQTIPKRSKSAKYIRRLFTAPEGYELVEIDYHVSELRWVAHVADDKKMKEIFQQGKDPHAITGLRMRGLPENYEFKDGKEKKETRQHSKPINFGLIYLLTPKGLKKYSEQEFGVKISQKQAEEFYNMFLHQLYKQIPVWHKKDEAFLRKHGYLRASFGRKRILPNINSEDETAQQQALRTGINFRIQNPSSDGNLLGGYNASKDERMNKTECRPVLSVHDALIWETKKGCREQYVPIIKNHMEELPTEKFGFTLKVPLKTEVEVGDNLADTEEIDL